MTHIQDTMRALEDTLSQQQSIFTNHQNMHFDWLRSIRFQLDALSDRSITLQDGRSAPDISTDQVKEQNKALAARQTQLASVSIPPVPETPRAMSRCGTSPSLVKPHVHFIDDTSMLDSLSVSETDDSECDSDIDYAIPFTVSGTYSELSQSATSFHAQWQEMLEMRRAQTVTPDIPFKFSFEGEETAPLNYEITDDEDIGWGSDDEIYEKNPFEVHGKVIPIWARQENLTKHLREQKDSGISGDDIFADTLKTCTLTRIFGAPPRRISTENDPILTNQSHAPIKRATSLRTLC